MPQSQKTISHREREGYLTAKSPNLSAKIWYGLTVHICFFVSKFTSKIFQIYAVFWQNFQQIIQIPRNSPQNSANHAKFAPFIDPLYIMFQMPAPAENSRKFQRIKQNSLHSPTNPTNYVKFAQKFIHF